VTIERVGTAALKAPGGGFIQRFRASRRAADLRPYQWLGQSLSGESAVEEAERAMSGGWVRRGDPAVDLAGPISWESSAAVSRSWSYHIHCWDMLDPLLQGFHSSQQHRYLEGALRIADEWIAECSFSASPSFAWYDMAVGLRAIRLAYLIDAGARSEEVPDDTLTKLLLSAVMHMEYLAKDANIAFHTNHGLYQVCGQLELGGRLPEIPGMAELSAQGTRRLDRILKTQFSEESVHLEHSPDYHRMVIKSVKAVIESGLILDDALSKQYRAMEKVMARFVLPNGHIVNLGDTDDRDMSLSLQSASTMWLTDEMRWAVTGGRLGKSIRGVSSYPASGYAIVRAVSAGDEDPSRDSYLCANGAFHSRTHKHADNLSFVWFDRGEPIFMDSGRYGYLDKVERDSELWNQGFWYGAPERVYVESTAAHNCVEIDGTSYPRRDIKPFRSAIRRSGESGGVYFIEMETQHFRGMRHIRMLLLLPGQWLVVLDGLWDNLHRPHDFTQWLHLAPGASVRSIDPQGFDVTLPGQEQLRILQAAPGPVATDVIQGRKEPGMQGWWSPRERELIPAPVVGFRVPEPAAEAYFCTLCVFSDDADLVSAGTRLTRSQRAASLTWRMNGKQMRLQMRRPARDDVTVELQES